MPRRPAQTQPFGPTSGTAEPTCTPTRPPTRILALGGRVGVRAGTASTEVDKPERAGGLFRPDGVARLDRLADILSGAFPVMAKNAPGSMGPYDRRVL